MSSERNFICAQRKHKFTDSFKNSWKTLRYWNGRRINGADLTFKVSNWIKNLFRENWSMNFYFHLTVGIKRYKDTITKIANGNWFYSTNRSLCHWVSFSQKTKLIRMDTNMKCYKCSHIFKQNINLSFCKNKTTKTTTTKKYYSTLQHSIQNYNFV